MGLEQLVGVDGGLMRFGPDRTLALESGATLNGLEIAYRTYGQLNAARSNAILICHALTLDQHVASVHPVTGKPGWWTQMVGEGRPIDPERHFIICSNVVGGCMGTTGPSSIDPETGKVYGLSFPMITIGDMVRAQVMLIDALGIETLFAVIGGSMGGMQVLQWAADYPERIDCAICIAAAPRHSAQNIAFHEVGRQAIMADPNWLGGEYAASDVRPEKGLAVARMAAHITYLSEPALQRKFGRELQRDGLSWGFDADFQVESYLPATRGPASSTGSTPIRILYISRAMDYFDLARRAGAGCWPRPSRARAMCRSCVLSTSPRTGSYPTVGSRAIVRALTAGRGARAALRRDPRDRQGPRRLPP